VTAHEISPIPREARPYQGEPAGVVTRLVANTIDALVVAAVMVAWYAGIIAVLFMLDPRNFQFPDASFLWSIAAALGISFVYLAAAWWLVGRTYGDHVMGIRVVGRKGQKLGLPRALARSAACVVFPIGLFWCVMGRERRSVQDILLWTSVVYDWLPGKATEGPGDS
jgi:uncharacterized RDD family membrane protein YckC